MKEKWKLLLGMLILTMLVTNCKKDEPDGSIERNKFINEVIAFTEKEVLIKTPFKIHELEINKNTVDFNNLKVIDSKYAMAEFKDNGLIKNPDEYTIVLYYLKNKEITTANVIKFESNLTAVFIRDNLDEILSFDHPDYSGTINITSLYGKFLAEVELEKGETVATTSLSGVAQNDPVNSESNLKSVTCTAWYLTVTTYYTLSPPTVVKTYLGTTCSGEGTGGGGGDGTQDDPDAIGKPCFGDPILSPEVAPTQNGSLYGGMYGCTRTVYDAELMNCYTPPPYTYNRKHNGIDIKAELNSDLYSMYSGEIVGVHNVDDGDLGKWVKVRTVNESGISVIIQYCHLNSITVSNGASIDAGKPLGKTGSTGYTVTSTTTTHVHIVVYLNAVRTNPISFFGTIFNEDGTIDAQCII